VNSYFRILMTTEPAGDIWHYCLELCRGLSALHIETVLAMLGKPRPTQFEVVRKIPGARLIDMGLSLDWATADAPSVINAGKAVADLAEQCGASLVQLNKPALAAGTLFTVPVVAVQHSCVATQWKAVRAKPLPSEFAWRTTLLRHGLQAADIVVTSTAAFAEATRRAYELSDLPRAVHIGRAPLNQTAFAAMHPLRPDSAAIMFDHECDRETLGESELARRLAARPVFVSTALYEPFGLAVLEAAAAGCPLILSDIPTFRELWDGAAIFVPPHDEEGFRKEIAELAGDDLTRQAMGTAAQQRAARYTREAMAAQMANIYRRLLPAVSRPVLAAKVAA
jgi:hypothetical protein